MATKKTVRRKKASAGKKKKKKSTKTKRLTKEHKRQFLETLDELEASVRALKKTAKAGTFVTAAAIPGSKRRRTRG